MRRAFTSFFRIGYALLYIAFLMISAPSIGKAADAQPAPSAYTGRYQPTTVPPIPDDVYNKMSPDEQEEADEYLQAMDAENKNSFDLYGKVVDQNGQPVVGAKVRGNVLLSVSMVASASKDYFTTTDKNGEFNFTGLHGTSFGVAPSKEGYEYDSRQPPNWTKDYKPDPAHPMVFTLYKLQDAEPMIHQDFHFSIACDGTPVNADIIQGKSVTSGGDLVITFTRNPVQIHRGTPFEWTLTLKVPDGGGLFEMKDSYPNLAPDNGYQQTVTLGTGPNPKSYVNSANQTYYFKSPDGKYYGRITIRLQSDFQPPPIFFQIDAYINPSGSRNLEFDEAKQVKP